MSKKSPQKTERRRKRKLKKQKRDDTRRQIDNIKQQQFEPCINSPSTFNKEALLPPTNTVSSTKHKPVLTVNQGFDLQKWKPNEEIHPG